RASVTPLLDDMRRLGASLHRIDEERIQAEDRAWAEEAARAREDARRERRERKEETREMAREVGREIAAEMKAAGLGGSTNIDMRGSIMPDQRAVDRLDKILEDKRRGKRRYGPGSK
ncbi:MAG: hypothetical protein QF701_07695, partial [Nitrospinota bacterium]|nr:hypothetical protein [Nitrospinota bacterium]